ncbi:MAG: hypothetical protein IKI92_04965 [Anaerotignum sp.]|nr:hypothetical protein [Anaerotignum sp.]
MINILEDYIWRSIPDETFHTNQNLRKKADESGKILPYKGNTVVFLLDELYCALQDVVPLGDLCPHITLAYYCPGTYTREDAEQLRAALHPVERQVTLRIEDLVIQNFEDMNHYETI